MRVLQSVAVGDDLLAVGHALLVDEVLGGPCAMLVAHVVVAAGQREEGGVVFEQTDGLAPVVLDLHPG